MNSRFLSLTVVGNSSNAREQGYPKQVPRTHIFSTFSLPFQRRHHHVSFPIHYLRARVVIDTP